MKKVLEQSKKERIGASMDDFYSQLLGGSAQPAMGSSQSKCVEVALANGYTMDEAQLAESVILSTLGQKT